MRCYVCGWVDADDDHERTHLRSQYDYLKREVARLKAELADEREPRGGNIVIDAILKLTRGLTRPLVTLAFSGAFIALTFLKFIPAEALEGAALLILGFWFLERHDRNKGAPTES